MARIKMTEEEKKQKQRECQTAYYWAHRDKLLAIKSADRKANPEKYRARYAKWYQANREKDIASGAAYQKAHPEKARASSAKWRKAHPEKARSVVAKWEKAHPGRVVAWHKSHPENARAATTKYRKNHPEVHAANQANRRARILNADGSYTAEEVRKLLARQKFRCAACKKSIKDGYHRDHILPLAQGGSNAIRNIQLLCPKCNMKKSAKHPIIFMQEMGYLI